MGSTAGCHKMSIINSFGQETLDGNNPRFYPFLHMRSARVNELIQYIYGTYNLDPTSTDCRPLTSTIFNFCPSYQVHPLFQAEYLTLKMRVICKDIRLFQFFAGKWDLDLMWKKMKTGKLKTELLISDKDNSKPCNLC